MKLAFSLIVCLGSLNSFVKGKNSLHYYVFHEYSKTHIYFVFLKVNHQRSSSFYLQFRSRGSGTSLADSKKLHFILDLFLIDLAHSCTKRNGGS